MLLWLHMRLLTLLARIVRRRFARRERLAAERRLVVLAVVVAVVRTVAARVAARLVIRLTLAKLLLGGDDQAEVMLRVLIIILCRDRISGTLRVTSKLDVFFSNMGSRTPDFNVRSIGFVHARQWILVMATFAVATTHALVLPVSHDLLFRQPLICGSTKAAVSLR